MPRSAAESPRQMLPPPITTATCTPRSRTSLMRSAMSRTTAGEMLSRPPRSWTASPLNLSTMRSYTGASVSMTADEHPNRRRPGLESKMRKGEKSTCSAHNRSVPSQEFRGGHSPFPFKLNFAERKGSVAGSNAQVFIAAQNLSGLAIEADNRRRKNFEILIIDFHERAGPGIERADFSLN